MTRSLLSAYLQAWPFALAHFALFVVVAWEAIIRSREASLLERAAYQSDANALREFLGVEPRVVGSGLIDGLSSLVEDRLDRLNNHVNLFLLVGIAGTFFGMFHLSVVDSNNARNLQIGVQESLNHALPVGFAGATLAIVGHLVSSWLGRRLRGSVSIIGLTRPAAGPDEALRSLVPLLREAVDSLRTVLTPLAGVDESLARALEPVTNRIQQHFDSQQKAMSAHFAGIETALGGFNGTLRSLQDPINRMAQGATEVQEAHGRMLTSLERAEQLIETRAAALEALHSSMAAAAGLIHAAIASMEVFPGQLDQAMKSTFRGMGEHWRDAVDGYSAAMAQEAAAATTTLRASVDESSRRLQHAVQALDDFSANAGLRLTKGIDDASARLAEPIRAFEVTVRREMPEAIVHASAVLDRGLARVNEMHGGIERLASLTESVRQSLDAWADSRNAITRASQQLSDSAQTLATATGTLTDLERSYMTIRWPRRRRSR